MMIRFLRTNLFVLGTILIAGHLVFSPAYAQKVNGSAKRGPGVSGGGNSLQGLMIESLVIDPSSHFQRDFELARATLNKVERFLETGQQMHTLFSHAFRDKTWYLLPSEFPDKGDCSVHIYRCVSRQTEREGFISEPAYLRLTAIQRQVFWVREIMVALRMLPKSSNYTQCMAHAPDPSLCMGTSQHSSANPALLNGEYDQVARATGEILVVFSEAEKIAKEQNHQFGPLEPINGQVMRLLIEGGMEFDDFFTARLPALKLSVVQLEGVINRAVALLPLARKVSEGGKDLGPCRLPIRFVNERPALVQQGKVELINLVPSCDSGPCYEFSRSPRQMKSRKGHAIYSYRWSNDQIFKTGVKKGDRFQTVEIYFDSNLVPEAMEVFTYEYRFVRLGQDGNIESSRSSQISGERCVLP